LVTHIAVCGTTLM